MDTKGIKINCYLEGIRIPVINYTCKYARNELSSANIVIPISDKIYQTPWANAFIQLTFLDKNSFGSYTEKLLFQGLCTSLNVLEEKSLIVINAESLFGSFNLNTTLDYVSPRKYGILSLEEDKVIYVGNEEKVATPPMAKEDLSYRLSARYFFVDQNLDEEDPLNHNKLQYIINRTPLAEKFAFSFFEQMDYNNFLLTKSYVDRFNLLAKTEKDLRIKSFEKNIDYTLEQSKIVSIELDTTRKGAFKYAEDHNDSDNVRTTNVPSGTPSGAGSGNVANLQDVAKNDTRRQYISFYSDRDRQWGDKLTIERILTYGEKMYKAFGKKLYIGDLSGPFVNGKWTALSGHKTHNDGASADLDMDGIMNSKDGNYTTENAVKALSILINEVGTRSASPSVYFNDDKVGKGVWSQPELKGKVEWCSGHYNHFHVFFVDRQI